MNSDTGQYAPLVGIEPPQPAQPHLALAPEPRPALVEAQRLQGMLQQCDNDYPNLHAAARRMGMSSRTLTRRLTEEGTSYTEILNEVRMGRAASLLRIGQTIHAVGRHVGYSDPSNFRRAFKRWTGMTPDAYRRTLLNG